MRARWERCGRGINHDDSSILLPRPYPPLLPLPQDDDEDDNEDLDSDDEALRYEAELEEQLEESYTEYLQRRGKREELIKVSYDIRAP